MYLILRVLLIVFLGITVMFFTRKFIESVYNVLASRKKHFHDSTRRHEGIVFNAKTGKLEADNSLILPF